MILLVAQWRLIKIHLPILETQIISLILQVELLLTTTPFLITRQRFTDKAHQDQKYRKLRRGSLILLDQH